LYNNKYDGEYLLPEFKHIDFLWLFKGDMVSDTTVNETVKELRNIHGVQLVNELTNAHIRNKGHLIF
jgi:23S rRNA U2552 (ribose-2'-O)-methylase RlmE/FtsJ